MATRAEIIADFKNEYPTIRSGSDELGYTDLSPEEYEATINRWADNVIKKAQAAADKEAAKEAAHAKLEALGLTTDDLKALGL
jgi:DUF438 domain-containing protein